MDQRKNNGGARKGAGRKSKGDEEDLLQILDSAWPKKDRITAIKAIAERAMMGDLAALILLMAYTYGKPKEKHELTGKNGKDLIPVLNVTLNAEPSTPEETDPSVSESSN